MSELLNRIGSHAYKACNCFLVCKRAQEYDSVATLNEIFGDLKNTQCIASGKDLAGVHVTKMCSVFRAVGSAVGPEADGRPDPTTRSVPLEIPHFYDRGGAT
jgi:hypothetical protein